MQSPKMSLFFRYAYKKPQTDIILTVELPKPADFEIFCLKVPSREDFSGQALRHSRSSGQLNARKSYLHTLNHPINQIQPKSPTMVVANNQTHLTTIAQLKTHFPAP
jgi:hypothetical protein